MQSECGGPVLKLLKEEFLFADSDMSIQETEEWAQDFSIVHVKLFISQEEICDWTEFLDTVFDGTYVQYHSWFSWGDFAMEQFLSDISELIDRSPRLVRLSRDRYKEALQK